jgi:hypothetical protein
MTPKQKSVAARSKQSLIFLGVMAAANAQPGSFGARAAVFPMPVQLCKSLAECAKDAGQGGPIHSVTIDPDHPDQNRQQIIDQINGGAVWGPSPPVSAPASIPAATFGSDAPAGAATALAEANWGSDGYAAPAQSSEGVHYYAPVIVHAGSGDQDTSSSSSGSDSSFASGLLGAAAALQSDADLLAKIRRSAAGAPASPTTSSAAGHGCTDVGFGGRRC